MNYCNKEVGFIERNILIAAIVFVPFLYLLLKHIHFPKERITDEIKAKIMDNGLIHFTMMENAYSIQKDGLLPGMKKAMYRREENMVWMYINDPNEFQSKVDTIHSKGKRKAYDAVVLFQGITEENIVNMRYRRKDMAVIHYGLFRPSVTKVFKLSELNNKL